MAEFVAARARVAGVVRETPLLGTESLSNLSGAELALKAENLQKTGSFKLRGATNRVALHVEEARRQGRVPGGVVTASSGNHGQAVAYAARHFGVQAVVVVPENAAAPKVAAAEGYGAEVVRCGTTSRERLAMAERLAAERGFTYIAPYDDPGVVAGQGTLGLEIAEQRPDTEVVLAPIGGGGLISGIAMAMKAKRPGVVVVGVEPEGSRAASLSRARGEVVELPATQTIADGLRKLAPGRLTFQYIQAFVDDIVTVSDEEIADAVRLLAQRCKLVVEPSGAVSVAAALSGKAPVRGRRTVAVLSGGNVDLTTLAGLLAG